MALEPNRKFAVCSDCGKEMSPGTGCGCSHIMLGGKDYERIKAGDDLDFDPNMEVGDVCHDCNAGLGQYHHSGCDAERCPVCSGQLISCDCG